MKRRRKRNSYYTMKCLILMLFALIQLVGRAQVIESPINDGAITQSFRLKMEELYKSEKSAMASFEELNKQLKSNKTFEFSPKEEIYDVELSGTELYKKAKKGSLIIGKLAVKQNDPNRYFLFLASAFTIDKSGICVTNYHVLDEVPSSDDIYRFVGVAVMDCKGNVYPVSKVLACSERADLAVFRVNNFNEDMEAFPLRKEPMVGENIGTISNPFNHLKVMLHNYTTGIVNRVSYSERKGMRMNISADYAQGSSGGPIFDSRGNIVGIISTLFLMQNSSKQTLMHVKDAIPVNELWNLFSSIN